MSDSSLPPNSSPPPLPSQAPVDVGAIRLRWALVAIFFSLLIALTLQSRERKHEAAPKVTPTEMVQVRMALQMESFARYSERTGSSTVAASYRSNSTSSLSAALREVAKDSLKNPDSAALYAAIATALRKPIDNQVLDKIRLGKGKEFKSLSEIYSSSKLDPKRAAQLSKEVANVAEIGDIAAYQALEKGGDTMALERAFPKESFFLFILLALFLMGGVVAGFGAWALYALQRGKPEWQPKDHPFSHFNADQASKLGLLGVAMIGLFLVTGEITGVAFPGLPDHLDLLISMLTFLTIFFGILKIVKVGGRPLISLLNQSPLPIWRQCLIGLGGWAANLPILGLLLLILSPLIKSTNADHPMNQMITEGGGMLATLAIFLAAAVSAPLWEETVFRGALFGGMRSAMKSRKWAIPASIFLSSLCFASIHPQGPALWLILGWIGAMGCLLTYHTRSIIPSMVMHAVHNGVLVALSLTILG